MGWLKQHSSKERNDNYFLPYSVAVKTDLLFLRTREAMPIPVAKTIESRTRVSTTITAALGMCENFICTPSDGTLPVVEIERCKCSGTSVSHNVANACPDK